MSILGIIPILGPIIEKIIGVVDKAVPDKDLAEKLKKELQSELIKLDYDSLNKEIEAKAKVLTAEIQGESWSQKNWRPVLMLSITAIVVNNYILYPYLSLFGFPATVLQLPETMWNLMTVGVGGYIAGRSAEKLMDTWKNGGKE